MDGEAIQDCKDVLINLEAHDTFHALTGNGPMHHNSIQTLYELVN